MILLDAVGTVIYPDPPVGKVYADIGQRFGSRVSASQVGQRFQAAFDDAFQRQPERRINVDLKVGEEAERERWRSVVSQVLDDISHAADEPFEQLWDHFAQPSSWRVFEDAAGLLSVLRGWRIPFGIASNFDGRLFRIVHSLCGIAEENVFVSSVIGAMKPQQAFYRHVLHELGMEPHEVLMVGDDREKDYEGARDVGMQACFVLRSNNGQGSSAENTDQPPSSINSLKVLVDWLRDRVHPL